MKMSSLIESSFEQSFIRLSCSGYLTLGDHARLFRAVHNQHRSGLSLQNFIETTQPDPRQVLPYIELILFNGDKKPKHQLLNYLMNYVLGITDIQMSLYMNYNINEFLQNAEIVNSDNENEPMSYFRTNDVVIDRQNKESTFLQKINSRKILFLMIKLYRNSKYNNCLHYIDWYFQRLIQNCIVDSCIPKIFSYLLRNKSINISQYVSAKEPLSDYFFYYCNKIDMNGLMDYHIRDTSHALQMLKSSAPYGKNLITDRVVKFLKQKGLDNEFIFQKVVKMKLTN